MTSQSNPNSIQTSYSFDVADQLLQVKHAFGATSIGDVPLVVKVGWVVGFVFGLSLGDGQVLWAGVGGAEPGGRSGTDSI